MQRAGAQEHAHLHIEDAAVVAHHLLMHLQRLLGGVFGTAGSTVLRQVEDGVDLQLHLVRRLRNDRPGHHRPGRQLLEERGGNQLAVDVVFLHAERGRTVARRMIHAADGEVAQPGVITKLPDTALQRLVAFVVERRVMKDLLRQIERGHLAPLLQIVCGNALMAKIWREPVNKLMRFERPQGNPRRSQRIDEGAQVMFGLCRRAALVLLPVFFRAFAVDAEPDRLVGDTPALGLAPDARVREDALFVSHHLQVFAHHPGNIAAEWVMGQTVFGNGGLKIVGNTIGLDGAGKDLHHIGELRRIAVNRQTVKGAGQPLIELGQRIFAACTHIARLHSPDFGDIDAVVENIGLLIVEIVTDRHIIHKGRIAFEQGTVLQRRQRWRSGEWPFTAGTHEEVDERVDPEARLYRPWFRRLGASGCAFLSRPALAPVPEVINQPHGTPPAPVRNGRARRGGTS